MREMKLFNDNGGLSIFWKVNLPTEVAIKRICSQNQPGGGKKVGK